MRVQCRNGMFLEMGKGYGEYKSAYVIELFNWAGEQVGSQPANSFKDASEKLVLWKRVYGENCELYRRNKTNHMTTVVLQEHSCFEPSEYTILEFDDLEGSCASRLIACTTSEAEVVLIYKNLIGGTS